MVAKASGHKIDVVRGRQAPRDDYDRFRFDLDPPRDMSRTLPFCISLSLLSIPNNECWGFGVGEQCTAHSSPACMRARHHSARLPWRATRVRKHNSQGAGRAGADTSTSPSVDFVSSFGDGPKIKELDPDRVNGPGSGRPSGLRRSRILVASEDLGTPPPAFFRRRGRASPAVALQTPPSFMPGRALASDG